MTGRELLQPRVQLLIDAHSDGAGECLRFALPHHACDVSSVSGRMSSGYDEGGSAGPIGGAFWIVADRVIPELMPRPMPSRP